MFGRKLFGRKQVNTAPLAPPVEVDRDYIPEGRYWSYETLADQASRSLIGKTVDQYSWNRAFMERLSALSVIERGDVLVSLVPMAPMLNETVRYQDGDPEIVRRNLCLSECLSKKDLAIRPEHVGAFVTLITTVTRVTTSQYTANKVVQALKVAIAEGGFVTSADCARLADYAQHLRGKRTSDRAGEKRYAALVAAVDKLAGTEISTMSVLLDRCEEAETGLSFEPATPQFRFCATLMAAVAEELTVLEGELRAKAAPAWQKNEQAFAERFPVNGVVDARFGQWQDDGLTLDPVELREMLTGRAWTDEQLAKERPDLRDFAQFRAFLKDRKRALASPALYRDAISVRHSHDAMVRYNWNGKSIPAVERLGDLSDPQHTELLEQFVIAKQSPKAPTAWLKKSLVLIKAIGPEIVQQSVLDWLTLFHTPCVSPRSIAEAYNSEAIALVADQLDRDHPEWKTIIDTEQLPAVARSIAFNIASGHVQNLPFGLSLFTLQLRDREPGTFAFNPYSAARHLAQAGRLTKLLSIYAHQTLSADNEQVVRAALWLLPHLPDQMASIEAMEKSALAGVALKVREYRSITATNAAVAGLVTMGSPAAQLALLRLSQQIDDGNVRNAISKVLSGLADPVADISNGPDQ